MRLVTWTVAWHGSSLMTRLTPSLSLDTVSVVRLLGACAVAWAMTSCTSKEGSSQRSPLSGRDASAEPDAATSSEPQTPSPTSPGPAPTQPGQPSSPVDAATGPHGDASTPGTGGGSADGSVSTEAGTGFDGGSQRPDAGTPASDAGEAPAGCPNGQSLFHPGCEPPSAPLQEGCYQQCSGAADDSCPTGSSCQGAWINPCVCTDLDPELSCCAACGAETWLCLQDETSATECTDRERTTILAGGSNSWGLCVGECMFELAIDAGTGTCDDAQLTTRERLTTTTLRTNRGLLTPRAHEAARELATAVQDATLEATYGCPDCADGGASTITLLRSGVESTHEYEFGSPPPALQELDAFVQELITSLRSCESGPLITIDGACTADSL